MKFQYHIKPTERGLVFKHGALARVVGPSSYWLPAFPKLRGIEIDVIDTLTSKFEHKWLDMLVKIPALRSMLHVLDLGDSERAVVFQEKRARWILGPGRYAFWKEPSLIQTETFNVDLNPRLEHPAIDAILKLPEAQTLLQGIDVSPYEEVIVFRNAEAIARVRQGRYVMWRTGRPLVVRDVDLREQVADVSGQEIMTRDKVTLRINLVVTSRVVDALKAVSTVKDWAQTLYRDAQLALREIVGVRTLDQLLSDKDSVGAEIRNALRARAASFGVEIRGVGLRDVILPGDMKTILNQVIAAKKQAEANVIKRREETAAARSQANTAKLLAENPTLRRIKEMEMLQEVLAGADVRFVLGQGDVAGQVRALASGDRNDSLES